MANNHDPEVLVVGAGPTGLVAANELARHGVACRIVDKSPGISPKSRAIAIQARTLEAIEIMRLGLDEFLRRGHPVRRGRIFAEDGGLLAEVDFDHLATRYPYMLLLPQDETERIFESCLNARGMAVERGTELIGCAEDGTAVRATLKHVDGTIEEARFDWLIGCDGAHSAVRAALGFEFEGGDYEDAFMLADVSVDAALDRSEFQVFTAPEGPLAFFPLEGDRYRIVADNPPADWTKEPTLAQCQALVDARGPGGIRLSNPRWLAKFWLHHRQARELRRGRVFLAGDAAHIHSPAGGQGMNTGIQDVFNLAWKLALVVRGAADARQLDTYQAERWPVDAMVIRNSDRLTRLMTLKNPVGRYLRDRLVPIVAGFGAVRRRAGEAVSELAIGYRGGPLAEEHALAGAKPAAGDRAPDVDLDGASGTVRLYDLVAEGKPVLVLLEGPHDGQAAERVRAAVSAAEAKDMLRIAEVRAADAEFRDPEGAAAAAYGGSAAYLIRPDGYVGFRAPIAEAATLLPNYLDRLRGRLP